MPSVFIEHENGMRRLAMKSRTAPNVSLAIVVFAAVATVALRVAARRREPRLAPGTEPARVTTMAGEEQMHHVFHELHADGYNPLCAVCDGKYGSA
jgi:hypothetical protein